MTASRRVALLAVALCGLVGTPVRADEPSPPNVTAPGSIHIVGTQNAPSNPLPDPSGQFTITVRDFANNPVPGANVTVDLMNCTDAHLCQAVVNGQTVDCGGKMVYGITNNMGQVTMIILGAADNPGTFVPPDAAPGAGLNCARFYVDGVQVSSATVSIYDQDGFLGVSGVNGGDIGMLKNDVGAANLAGVYRGRSDYNANGVVNGADIGAFRDIVGRSGLGMGSATGCADQHGGVTYCP